MKFIVIDQRLHEEWDNEFETKEEAIKKAKRDWNYLTESEKKKCIAFYVLESVNPDEEAENHYDGNIILRMK